MNAVADEKRCSLQYKLLVAARDDEELSETLAKILCSSPTLRNHRSAVLLASSIVGFLCANGNENELSMDTFGYMLSLADESLDESALDAMFRQIEKGEWYDKTKHAWVKHPGRSPQPDVGYVVAYREFKKHLAHDRAAAVRLLRVSTVRFGEYPGWDFLAAAMLEDRIPAGSCPAGCGYYARAMSRIGRAVRASRRRIPAVESDCAEACSAEAVEWLGREIGRAAQTGERLRIGECHVPDGVAAISEEVMGSIMAAVAAPFCPKVEEDLRLAKEMFGFGPD